MKKYIIAAAAALAIGMALSACAKEGEAIVPIIVEGEAEQQQAAPTPEATQDMAAQVSKTQMVEGGGIYRHADGGYGRGRRPHI